MESQLEGSSQDTRDLIGYGFFETLQNVASHQPEGYAPFEQFPGHISEKIWGEIQRTWAGQIELISRYPYQPLSAQNVSATKYTVPGAQAGAPESIAPTSPPPRRLDAPAGAGRLRKNPFQAADKRR
jgi:hypothetical protein